MRLGLRARVAFWCAGLVIASGVLVVLILVVLSGRFLHSANQSIDPAVLGQQGAPAGQLPGGAQAPGGPGPGAGTPGAAPGAVGPGGPASAGGPGVQGAPAGQGAAGGQTAQQALDGARRAAADQAFRDVRKVGLLLVAGLSVAAIAVAWAVAGQIVRPLRRMTHTARAIALTDQLDRRLALDGPHDEVRELGDSFDAMLDRIQTVFEAQRSFVSNTSHELRTPLAVMRTEIDVALDDPTADPAVLREALEAVGDELDHTVGLVEAMLALSRAESLRSVTAVDLAEVAQARIDRLPPGTTDGLDVRLELGGARTTGDPVLLSRLVANLVANAARYNRPGGLLWVRTWTEGGRARVLVENDGPVVDPQVVPQLFARFVRRAEAGEGYGLGLAIVDAIVSTHQGTIVADARPQGGLRIEVALPQKIDEPSEAAFSAA